MRGVHPTLEITTSLLQSQRTGAHQDQHKSHKCSHSYSQISMLMICIMHLLHEHNSASWMFSGEKNTAESLLSSGAQNILS